jgi:hypothetical protein
MGKLDWAAISGCPTRCKVPENQIRSWIGSWIGNWNESWISNDESGLHADQNTRSHLFRADATNSAPGSFYIPKEKSQALKEHRSAKIPCGATDQCGRYHILDNRPSSRASFYLNCAPAPSALQSSKDPVRKSQKMNAVVVC